MCGVVGIIKKENETFEEKDFYSFLTLLAEAETRGRQATGCFYYFNNGKVRYIKTDETASKVVDFIPFLKDVRGMVGHTRASTGGMPSDNINNHPHEAGNWVLVHNGMNDSDLTSMQLDCASMCDTEEFVQSFRYFEEVEEVTELPELFRKSFKHMSGSWTLCFANTATNKLYLTTNGMSPLWLMYYEDGMMFSSEKGYFDRTEIVITHNKLENTNVGVFLKENDLDKELELYTAYTPSSDIVFDITNPFDIKQICEYEYSFDWGYGGGNWRNYSGYDSKTKSTVTDHKKSNVPVIASATVDTCSIVEMDIVESYYTTDPIEFNITTGHADNIEFDTDCILANFALRLLGDDPSRFNLTEGKVSNAVLAYGKGRTNLTKKMRKEIGKKFSSKFCSELFAYIDDEGYHEATKNYWDYLNAEDDTADGSVMNQYKWFHRVIAVVLGIKIKSDEFPEVDSAYSECPNSEYICSDCQTTRKILVENSGEVHICPSCYSEFSLDNNNSLLY